MMDNPYWAEDTAKKARAEWAQRALGDLWWLFRTDPASFARGVLRLRRSSARGKRN